MERLDGYTAYLETRGHEISPEDENYTEELREIAASFRSFDAALDQFLTEKEPVWANYTQTEKITCLKTKMEQAGVTPLPRNIKKWYTQHKTIERATAFSLCFALGFSVEETDDFFRRVCLDRSFDFHDMQEAVCYFGMRRGLSYLQVHQLLQRTPAGRGQMPPKSGIDFGEEVLFTGSIAAELDRFADEEELLAYFESNAQHFCYNHATAYWLIQEIWSGISRENGLAHREQTELQGEKRLSGRKRSVNDLFLQILGMNEKDEWNRPLFAVDADRSLKPILKDNALLNRIAERDFPDRLGLEEILAGKHKSNEKVRKTLVLLSFYQFWAEAALRAEDSSYHAHGGDADRCIDEMNSYLLEAGYPPLYYGNPFDWLFLFAAEDEYPLDTFRNFIRELYIYKEEMQSKEQARKENGTA